jgi:DHA1 family inner membrane transport protein
MKAIAMPLPLLALAIASFGIGTTEFIIMGLLPDLSRDLGVSIPRAGMLVTAYALGVTFGAPLVALAMARLPRKTALLALLGVFIVGNFLCAVAPTYTLLLLARILTALCHGAFFGIGAVVASGLVPREQRSRAIALMFAGLTLATIFGVPAGTALGQWAGWRASFWAIVPIGVIATIAVAVLVPRQAEAAPVRLLREFGVLRRPQVLLAMSMSTLSSASLFSVFTYITPLLENVTGLSPHSVTFVLVLFGVGVTIGNLVGGRLADWRQTPALIGIFLVYALVGAVLVYASHAAVPAIVCVLVWGAVSLSPGAALQTRVVDHAFEAPNLASTLNQSAFNLGNAIGAWTGGAALSLGASYDRLPWLASGFAASALVLALISALLGMRRTGLAVPAA